MNTNSVGSFRRLVALQIRVHMTDHHHVVLPQLLLMMVMKVWPLLLRSPLTRCRQPPTLEVGVSAFVNSGGLWCSGSRRSGAHAVTVPHLCLPLLQLLL